MPSPTVHLVYPSGPQLAAPWTIGRHLAVRLAKRYRVRTWRWDAVAAIRPRFGDVLLGHPHPAPWTTFRMSSSLPGWRRVLAMAPFVPDPDWVGFHDAVIDRCDAFLAITGGYWFDRLAGSPLAHWAPRLVHLDLAVDRTEFPRVKAAFAAPGRRRFVYVGNTNPPKNTPYLAAIARAMPEAEIAWVGEGRAPIAGVRALGRLDFATDAGRAAIGAHDFLLTVGRRDANPTTVLEAMAFGLVPVCTRESGYADVGGIVNVPLDDVEGAIAVLRRLQHAPDAELEGLRAASDALLETRFTWDRFARQVVEAIEGGPPAPISRPVRRWAALRRAAWTGPLSPLRPSNALALALANAAPLVARIRRRGAASAAEVASR